MTLDPIFQLKDDYLLVTTQGEIKNLSDIMEDTIKIHAASQSLKVSRILTDNRKLNFDVALSEAFNLVRYYENKLPNIFGEISLVTIVRGKDLEIAEFWESICNKRGFNVAVFTDYAAGEKWLLKQAVYQ